MQAAAAYTAGDRVCHIAQPAILGTIAGPGHQGKMAVAWDGMATDRPPVEVEPNLLRCVEAAPGTLTPKKRQRLQAAEAIISDGLRRAWASAQALAVIKDEELWRGGGYKGWHDYLKRRWQITPQNGRYAVREWKLYTRMKAARVAVLPTYPSQLRGLLCLPEEEQIPCWQAAVEAAGGEVPGMETVRAVERSRRKPKETATATATVPALLALPWRQALVVEQGDLRFAVEETGQGKRWAARAQVIHRDDAGEALRVQTVDLGFHGGKEAAIGACETFARERQG